jgi:hypothetical protein
MNEPITISNETPALTGMDFLALRQQGIELIQQLSGNVWTDYNLHDPGITILEQLCYAITDLSYRLSFDIQDLLTYNNKQAPEGAQQFFTAREILSTRPVTLSDYRKLLIDINGVKNAWLQIDPALFTNMYYDQKAYQLAFNSAANRVPVQLSGLYRVIIEQDEGVGEQDLPNLLQTVKDKLHAYRNLSEDFSIIEVLPAETITLKAEIDIADNADADAIRASIYVALAQFISPSIRFYSLSERLKAGLMPEDIFSGPVLEHGFIDDTELQNFDRRRVLYKSDLYSLLLDIAGIQAVRSLSLESDKSITEQQGWVLKLDAGSTPKYKVISEVFKKDDISDKSEIKLYKKQIVTDLDLYEVEQQYNKLIADELITISAKVNIREHVDPNYVLAKIYRALNQLIQTYNVISDNQRIGFRDLPIIDAATISELLMGLYDVLSVKDIIISSNKSEGGAQFTLMTTSAPKFKLPAEFWTEGDIELSQADHPATELELAKFETEVLRLARAQAQNKPNDLGYDMTVLQGDYRELNDYISVQNDFPDSYGIGQAGLSELVGEQRKAQAKQLKAYLLVFDQLLANYFAQLEAAKHLLAVNPGQLADLNRTYFAQPVEGIVNLPEILNPTTDQTVLERLTEDVQDSNRFERKSRLLDHLLARFGEDFPDNKLIMYTQMAEYNDVKQNYLSEYANTSQNRFTAYNYLAQEPIWDSSNVPGLQRRISQLLGIRDPRRKVLSLSYDEGFHLVEHLLLRPVDEARLARFPRPITGFKQSIIMDNQIVCYSLQHGLKDGERIELIIPDQARQTVTVVIDEIAPVETSSNAFKIELDNEELRAVLLKVDSSDDYGWDYAQRSSNAITAFALSKLDSKQVICTSVGHGLQDGASIQLVFPDATALAPLSVVIDSASSGGPKAETSSDSFKIVVANDTLRTKLLAATQIEGYSWSKAVTAFTQSTVDEQQIICEAMQHRLKNGEQIQFILPDGSASLSFTVFLDNTEGTVETSANSFKIAVSDEKLKAELLAMNNPQGYGWDKLTNGANPRRFPRAIGDISVYNRIIDFAPSATSEQLICHVTEHGLLNGEILNLILPDQSILTQLVVVMDEQNDPMLETDVDHFKLVIADQTLRERLIAADTTEPYRWSYDDNTYLVCRTDFDHELQEGDKIKLKAFDYQTELAVMATLSPRQFTVKVRTAEAIYALTTARLKPVTWALFDNFLDFIQPITGISPPVIIASEGNSIEVTLTTKTAHKLVKSNTLAIFDEEEFYREYEVADVLTPNSLKIIETNLKTPLVDNMPVGATFYYAQPPAGYAITGIFCPDKQPIDIKPVDVTVTTDLQALQVGSQVAIYTSYTKYQIYEVSALDSQTHTFTVTETDPDSLLLSNGAVGMNWRWADATDFKDKVKAQDAKQISNIKPKIQLPEDGSTVRINLTSIGNQLQVNDEITLFGQGATASNYTVTEIEQDTFTVQEANADSSLLKGIVPGTNLNWVFVRKEYEPYSFQISFVLPTWLPRFKDTEFRQLLTETIIRETPAHIAINIHWFNRRQMNAFEQVYGNWLLRKLNDNATAGAIDTAAYKVLQALYQAKPLQEYDQEIFGEISQMTVNKDFRISYPYVEGVVSSDEVGGIGHMKIRQIGNEEMNTRKRHDIFQILFPED